MNKLILGEGRLAGFARRKRGKEKLILQYGEITHWNFSFISNKVARMHVSPIFQIGNIYWRNAVTMNV